MNDSAPRHHHRADAPPERAAPVLVEVTRGALVESRHRGAAAVVAPDGTVVRAWGDVERRIYPRSAIKPLQALPLVESGAADAYALGDAELALACASHTGERRHVAAVTAWLGRIGLDAGALACGAHPPVDRAALRALYAAGGQPQAVHNNCSGKHAGMLTTARHRGEPVAGYLAVDHPVQQRILGVLETMCGLDLTDAPRGIDGCSAPQWALPLGNLALGMARLADPADQPAARQAAAARLRRAMAAEPEMVHGSGKFATDVIAACGEAVLVKGGAEGVYTAALSELGLGVAVKIDDGAGRAAEVALLAVLRRLGALTGERERRLAERRVVPLKNWAGLAVGEIRPAPALADD